MRKWFTTYRVSSCITVLICLVGLTQLSRADDAFAVALSPKNDLVIFGPKGERVVDISVPTVSQDVTAGDASFQVSYGRDANNALTAILAPNSSSPQVLRFSVLGKKVVSDKQAVVTLTFPTANRVIIDPGYIGTVTVDSRTLHRHDLTEGTAPAPTPYSPAPSAPKVAAQPAPAPAVAENESHDLPPLHHESPAPVAVKKPEPAPQPFASAPAPSAPAPSVNASSDSSASSETDPNAPFNSALNHPKNPMGNGTNPYNMIKPPPLIGSLFAQPPPPYSLNMSEPGSKSGTVYWSEPVTPPNGTPPRVGRDEMKLVEVVGPVSVKSEDGTTKPGQSGMILPSGSTLITPTNSSAAVFIGGVNSARFLPNSEAKITHDLTGSVRHTAIDLKQGTVFSRVGRRTGETEDYKVKTPEGVAAARGTEFCDHRGVGSDGKSHHYVFVAKGRVDLIVAGQITKLISGKLGELGISAMPPAPDSGAIFDAILEALQPFNVKLLGVLHRLQDGTASPGDIAFYNNVIDTFVKHFTPLMIDQYWDYPNIYLLIPAARRAVNQDLVPFGTNPLTPY